MLKSIFTQNDFEVDIGIIYILYVRMLTILTYNIHITPLSILPFHIFLSFFLLYRMYVYVHV